MVLTLSFPINTKLVSGSCTGASPSGDQTGRVSSRKPHGKRVFLNTECVMLNNYGFFMVHK